MKETIFRYARSIRVRIISAFMAFLIFTLGYAGYFDFEGFEHGMTANALGITSVTKTGNYINKDFVSSTSHDGHSVSAASVSDQNSSHEFKYRYTGAVKTSKVSLYDYKTDTEIGATPTISNKYTDWGSEPFKQFNDAISNSVNNTLVSQNKNNITIYFKNTLNWSTVYIYLWNDKGNSGWEKHQMTYDSSLEKYVITFNLVDSSADNYLKYDVDTTVGNFVPKHLIFHNGSAQTINLNATLINEYSYSFKTVDEKDSENHYKCERTDSTRIIFDAGTLDNDIDSDGLYLHCWGDGGTTTWPGEKMTKMDGTTKYYLDFKGNFDPYEYLLTNGQTGSGNNQYCSTSNKCFNRVLKYGWTYEFKCEKQTDSTYKTTIYNVINPANKALYTDAKVCKYTDPLYFGCYYRTTQIAGTYADDFKPDGVSSYISGSNTVTFGGPYRNFYWQANLGMKSTGDGTGNNSVDVRGHAAVQGLVDDKLTLDAASSTATPSGALRQNGVELPYFSYQFQRDNPTLMTIYDKSGTGIDFPFYEILTDANNVRLAEDNLKIPTDQARFYQFNSEDVNLKFDTDNQQFLEETNVRIKSTNSKTGYFPFNSTNSNGVNDNLGFGTKFEMKFKLSEDGTVNTVSSTGGKSENPTKVHTMFEFLGDDDLWVFIDGNLVLDLGGTHDQTSGLIDFYTGTAYANKAITLGAGTGKDDLSAGDLSPTVGIIEKNVKDILSANGSYDSVTSKYNPNFTHTMTIFYLERGMMDSNLMIRYNYKPESNFSKMKIREVTDFSGVNKGLVDLTKKAADNDVFSYHVENSGTDSDTPQYTGILYPTYDTYKRKYKSDAEESMTDQLTGRALEYDTNLQTDSTAVFLDATATWDQADAVIAAWIWKAGYDGQLYLGTRVPNTDHVFQFRGYPSDANKIHFLRLDPIYKPYYSGNVGWPTGKYWNQSGDRDLKNGKKYTITNYDNSITVPSDSDPNYSFKVLKYDADNDSIFHPNAGVFTDVASTNYIWVDEFASLSGTQVDDITNGFTGKTDSSGNFCLMYGTAGTESSAEFENQFDRDSTMKVTQSGTLYSPTRSGTVTFSSSNRTVSEYYKTTVRAYDRVGAELTNHNNNSTGSGAGGSGGTESEYQLNYKTTANGMETDYKFNNNPNIRSDETLTVMMTEEFENSPNTGNLTVTKDIEDPVGNTESNVTREFEYKLTLTKVFNISGVDVTNNGNNTGYEKIVTKKTSETNTTNGNALTNSGETESTFTLKPGESLTIENIPTGTHYKIEEIGEKVSGTTIAYYEYNKVYKKTGSDWTNQNKTDGVIEGDIETDTTHEYKYANKRKVGSLTLSKSLVGESNAKTPLDANTTFELNVTLQADTGVNIKNYLGETPTFTCGTGTSVTNIVFDTNDNGKYTFTATIKPSQTIKLDNIPYGTTVTVEETQDSNHPVASYAYTDGGSNTYTNVIEHPSTVVTVTNTYRQITLTKTDSKDNSKKLQGAEYYLLRLKDGVNTTDAQASFESAAASYDTAPLATYFDIVSGTLTTQSDGTVVIKDSNVTNGLTPGNYYLFEQSAPSDYTRLNSFTDNKITISSTEAGNAQYTKTLTNVRKKGSLELDKVVASGSPEATFTFNVSLDGSAANLDLNQYGITGLTSSSYDSTTHIMTGTVSVASNASSNPTITNIPFGTTYTVTESATGWQEISTVYTDDANKKIDTESGSSIDKVTITNTKTGSLTIQKTITKNSSDSYPATIPEFTFTVELNNFPAGKTINDFNVQYNSTNQTANTFQVTISGLTSSAETQSITITGIPYGVTYTVTEDSSLPSGWAVSYDANKSGTINSSSVTTVTNTYTAPPTPVTGEPVTVVKTDENGNPIDSPAEFDLWYRDSTKHPTYTFNDPFTAPIKVNRLKITDNITIPENEVITTPVTVTTKEYQYDTDTVTTSSDSDWILPRSDNDYIYFRDYNAGTSLGEHDKKSFATGQDSDSCKQTGNRSWLETTLNRHSGHDQDRELIYDTSYWFAAQFTKNNGQNMVEYAMWERFVDKYTTNENTVVWKIQPPDGYTEVRFCLYHNSNCIRKTNRIDFTLGDIYHKTSWGGYWSNANSENCYYNVPIEKESDWAIHNSPTDLRQSGNGMKQAQQYKPTEQKVIFHCNSADVWHNIHIQFFDSNGNSVNGQQFPGYMMEPYAYAGSDYRIEKYLTYELTIPANAVTFQINNGVSSGPYAYKTEKKQLYTAANKPGKKNYANYFKLTGSKNSSDEFTLTDWTDYPSADERNKTYTTLDVDSDYDYVYFEKPAEWKNHVYAYFYGGGNLRADNWQRACYSVWPGVAPEGTEYNNGTQYYSDIYNYSYTGTLYNHSDLANETTNISNPESTFKIGTKIIYKFRIPKGERKNYSKVIFNDGLTAANGGKETGVISYNPGYIYNKNGSATKHYESSPTVSYTARSGNDDYIYVKTTNISTWDDIHIKFYDTNGTQILQGGHGYIMSYSGADSTYTYFRVPIPTEAAKFSLNNGMGKGSELETAMYDILRKSTIAAEPTDSIDYTTGKLVYEIKTDNSLDRTEPKFTDITPSNPMQSTISEQASGKDYTNTERHDKLKILDSAPWNIGIGKGKVRFYDASGAKIGPLGTYTLIQSKPDVNNGNKRWYTIEIPDNAKTFTVTYGDGTKTTAQYPIFDYSVNGAGIDGSWTQNGMYYETVSDGSLRLMENTIQSTEANDEIYSKRGDTLYLLSTDKNAWDGMTVTFKNSSGTDISGAVNITAKYLGEKNSDHWWSISIPTGAESFTVTKGSDTTAEAEIFSLSTKLSRYKKDYTLGDMQYRLPASVSTSKPDLLYPVFTQDDEYTLEIGGKTITTASGTPLVDESQIAVYSGAAAVTTPSTTGSEPTSPYPVLYNTNTDNVTYSWTTGGGSSTDNMLRFIRPSGWSGTPTATFYNGSDVVSASEMTTDTGSTYKVAVPNTTSNTFDSVVFNCGSNRTTKVPLNNANNYGKNYKCEKASTSITVSSGTVGYDNRSTKWTNVYAYMWQDNTSNSNASWPGVQMTDTDGDGIYTVSRSNNSWNKIIFNNGEATNPNTAQTFTLSIQDSNVFVPDTSKLYLKIDSNSGLDTTGQFRIYYWGRKDGNSPDPKTSMGDQSPQFDSTSTYEKTYNNFQSDITNKTGSICNNMIIFNWNNNIIWQTPTIDINSNNANGAGLIVYVYKDGSNIMTSVKSGAGNGDWKSSVDSWSLTENISSADYTATYQPEDRYGMISELNSSSTPVTDGTADANNYIYIDTTISDPYIMFYSDTTGTDANKIGGNSMATTGIKLSAVCGNSASPYKIRLPRNAQSFKIADGPNGMPGLAVPLVENITVDASTGQLASSGNTVSITGFRHAGTSFRIASDGSVVSTYNNDGYSSGKKLRTGYTISKETALNTPNPKTDADYVYFTNTSGTLTGTVYAYFYGSADGEFAQWPGIQSEGSYIDNAGNTVYRFVIPKGTNGSYSHVIFNNGSDSTRKITEAVETTGGTNYTLSNVTPQQYGTYDGTNPINAYNLAGTPKGTASSPAYTAQGTNRHIYIHNNGTQNLTSGVGSGTYKLDDIHVIFYDISNNPIGYTTGYIPDKLSSYTDYYRIQVPDDAVYFQITNGDGKGSGTVQYNARKSEIKTVIANGLYKFVSGKSDASEFITSDSTVPTSEAERQNPKYLLSLENERTIGEDDDVPESETFDVKLATVVTGTNGAVQYIKWLKKNSEGTNVDTSYLNHVLTDIYDPDNNTGNKVTNVKVVKDGTYYWVETVAPAGYEINENKHEFVKTGTTVSNATTNVKDKKISGKVILTKTAKEQVGTTKIGDTLAGAQFKLVKVNGSTEDNTLRFTLSTTDGKNTYSPGTGSYNNTGFWLTTGTDGKLTIEGLAPGDYYLEEQTAPAGYSKTDSNTNADRRVYFSIGVNTTVKNITCSDEMDPAYLMLYEHINEKIDAWGDPTFIFKITQTKYADNTDVPAASQRTHIVALTVDDDGKLSTDNILGSDYNNWYQESTDEEETVNSSPVREYMGMYHIDRNGKIRLEPGTYQVTRVPVSRYEFVASTYKRNSDGEVYNTNKHIETNKSTGTESAVTITIPANDTGIVHYYDKIAYYDKFTHEDTKINKFYKLNETTKANETAKGIRVEYKPKVTTTVQEADINIDVENTANDTTFNAWFINADGTERAMTIAEKSKLDIRCLPDDNNSADTSGFNFISPIIKITTPSAYKDTVYTLTADYKENAQIIFTTKFDIVFERS